MTVRKPNAICIGGEEVSNALEGLKPDWNFITPVNTIEDLYQGWDDETITQDLEVIFVIDTLFDNRGDLKFDDEENIDTAFENLVASVSPYCFFGILSYEPELQNSIRERINDSAYQISVESDLHYYFINTDETVKDSLDSKLSEFYENASGDSIDETVQILLGVDPNQSVEETQDAVSDEASAVSQEDSQLFTPAPAVQSTTRISSSLQGDLYTPTPRTDDVLELRNEDQQHIDGLGDVLCFTSSKGGVGKSTVSLSYATYLVKKSRSLAEQGLLEKPLKVAVIDMDVRDGQIGFFIGANSPTINDLHAQGLNQESLDKNVIHASNIGIDVVIASRRPKLSSLISIEFYRDLIRELRRRYDYVILDTSVNYLDPLLSEVCYPMSHKIIFAVEPINSSVISMTRWIQEVTHPIERNGMGISKRRVGVVINKVLPDVNMPGGRIMQAAQGLPILVAISSVPSAVAKATNTQAMDTLLDCPPIHRAMGEIAKTITGNKEFISQHKNS